MWMAALALAGCGGDGGITDLEGIYTIASWTVNSQGCDAEGPSVAATRQPFAYIKGETFLGAEFVNVVTCDSVAVCEDKARDGDTIHLGGFTFDRGSDSAGWTERSAFGFMRDIACEGQLFDGTLTSPAAGQIRIEERTSQPATYPPDMGECTDEGAEAAAANQPCAELEVVTLTKTGDF